MKRSKALGKVKMAVERLAYEMPLHAGLLSRWKLIENGHITETMAIGFRSGRFVVYVNPTFVEPLSMDELTAVLSHEANHVLFEHVFHEPTPTENRQARIIAEETVVNDWALQNLPGQPYLTKDFSMLMALGDTEGRYEILKEIIPPETTVTLTLDDHSTWEEIRKNGDIAKLASTLEVSAAWQSLTPEQRRKVKLSQTVQKALKAAAGIGDGAEASLASGKASVHWQKVLRRYVGRETQSRPVFGRPPRRFPQLVGIVPGRARQAGVPKVMAVIDTSASMTPAMLADISAELGVMARTYSVTVVECDTRIHAVYSYRPIKSVHGRGGTDLRPPFEPDFLREHKPDLVVYYTDGHGTAPDGAPPMPVIFCLTPGGRMPCGWGREIRLG